MGRKFIDYTNQKFGILTVVEKVNYKNKFDQILWLCKCDCGKEKICPANFFKDRIASCGSVECTSKVRGRIRKFYEFNEDFFSVPNQLNSYWAGFIAADFFIRTAPSPRKRNELTCSLAIKDKDQLVRFMTDIEHKGRVKERKRVRKGTKLRVAEISITSQKMIEDLETNFNIDGIKKTERLKPPTSLAKENKLAFIVGYIDGDGWLRYKLKNIDLGVCGTYLMVSWIKLVLDDELCCVGLGETSDVKTSRNLSYWRAYGKSWYLAELLASIPIPKMQRKLPRIHEYKKQRLARKRNDE